MDTGKEITKMDTPYKIRLFHKDSFREYYQWEVFKHDDTGTRCLMPPILTDSFGGKNWRKEVSELRIELMDLLFNYARKENLFRIKKQGRWIAGGRILRGPQKWKHMVAEFDITENLAMALKNFRRADLRKSADKERAKNELDKIKTLLFSLQQNQEQIKGTDGINPACTVRKIRN